jgi:pyridoxal phosphate enzyme (YggS family)
MTVQPDTLAGRLEMVRAGVADATSVADRHLDDITLIVVTKFHPQTLVRELHGLGVRNVGENRHQDAGPKAEALKDLDLTWHFVGQLQSKKTKAVIDYARVIHSLDRPSVVDALAFATAGDDSPDISVFIQLNLTDDPARGGVNPAELEALAERILSVGRIRLAGLMAVAPLGGHPRDAFAAVRAASDRLRTLDPHATALSMGMSADYRDAVLEGATHLRIGTAITGNRPNPG